MLAFVSSSKCLMKKKEVGWGSRVLITHLQLHFILLRVLLLAPYRHGRGDKVHHGGVFNPLCSAFAFSSATDVDEYGLYVSCSVRLVWPFQKVRYSPVGTLRTHLSVWREQDLPFSVTSQTRKW